MYSAVRGNPELGPHALDHLQTHLGKWCEEGDVLPPFRFHDAVTIHGVEAVLQVKKKLLFTERAKAPIGNLLFHRMSVCLDVSVLL